MDDLALIPVPSSSFIGIGIALGGNLLIAVALNTQKLAHQKLSSASEERRGVKGHARSSRPETHQQRESAPLLQRQDSSATYAPSAHSFALGENAKVYTVDPDTQAISGPLPNSKKVIRQLAADDTIEIINGAVVESDNQTAGRLRKKWTTISAENGSAAELGQHGKVDMKNRKPSVNSSPETTRRRRTSGKRSKAHGNRDQEASQHMYYKSKIWWLGLLLMALGELGNFTSYAFAPASIVAPLGTTALIANCFIAPLLLKERFRKQDLLGIALSVFGAVIIVLSGKSQNKSLDPSELVHAISQTAFIVYSSIALGLIVLLIILQRTSLGTRYLFVDISICALCGGFTVLTTKAFSGFLTIEFLDCFKDWITYPVLAVLAGTAILQLIYLNQALQHFESRVVVPTQFVTFTISAIIGSAILYRDFEDVSASKVAKFFFGCALVFSGVIILTRAKPTSGTEAEKQEGERSRAASPEIRITPSADPRHRSDRQDRDASEPHSSVAGENPGGDANPKRSRRVSQPLTSLFNGMRTPSGSRPGLSASTSDTPTVRKHRSFGTFPLPSSSNAALSTGNQIGTGAFHAKSPNIIALASAKPFSPGYILIAGGSFGERLVEEERRRRRRQDDPESGSSSASGQITEENSSESEEEHLEAGQDPGNARGLAALVELPAEVVAPSRDDLASSQTMKRSGTV